jgi:hypothetical protein
MTVETLYFVGWSLFWGGLTLWAGVQIGRRHPK